MGVKVRNYGRKDDGDGQGDREFAEETADDVAHEKQRDKHCNQ